jgi:hypothetical protein
MNLSEIDRTTTDIKSDEALRVETPRAGSPSASVEAAMAAIGSIDLSAVKRKVVDEKCWSEKIADYAELRYRRFLCIHLLNPRLYLVPPPDIDAFWHQHILFTRKYARDCEKAFGEFLHHNPASGAKGEAGELQRGFVETARFYAHVFGENYLAMEPEGLSSSWVELFE